MRQVTAYLEPKENVAVAGSPCPRTSCSNCAHVTISKDEDGSKILGCGRPNKTEKIKLKDWYKREASRIERALGCKTEIVTEKNMDPNAPKRIALFAVI